MKNNEPEDIIILGGGPAGIASAYYAHKLGKTYSLFEKSKEFGGNSRTLKHNEFFFDTGAHRFHDKDSEITEEIVELMGDDLKQIYIPSHIYLEGQFVHFPLTPVDIVKKLGFVTSTKSIFHILRHKYVSRDFPKNFEEHSVRQYGKSIAEKFLLNYSEKLWGISCSKLSVKAAGKRLKGLSISSMLREFILGQRANTAHLDGSFYYPKYGIGMINERLLSGVDLSDLYNMSKVTRLSHRNNRIDKITINEEEEVPANHIISSIPLNSLLHSLYPLPPKSILTKAEKLKFRNIKLLMLFIDKPQLNTTSGSIYFPDSEIPFTRVYEPRNRSIYMSPEGKTSLGIEFPFKEGDKIDKLSDKLLVKLAVEALSSANLLDSKDIIDYKVITLHSAYPVLEVGYDEIVQELLSYLNSFVNLDIVGRVGSFEYSWIHNQIRDAKKIIYDKYS